MSLGYFLMAALGLKLETTLTIGTDPSFGLRYGFRSWGVGSAHYGSLSDATLEGETIVELSTPTGVAATNLRILGTGVSSSLFIAVKSSSLGTLNAADATYTANDGSGNTLWEWTTGGPFPSTGTQVITFT